MKRAVTINSTDISTSCESSYQDLAAAIHLVTGRIVSIGADGKILVQFKNRPVTQAKFLSGSLKKEIEIHQLSRQQVLMVFEEGDPDKPIIIGLMEESLYQLFELDKKIISKEKSMQPEAEIDGERVILEATKEIQLKCGKSSITLTKEGRIIIKGIDIVTRSLSVNKVKGSCVKLN